MKLPQITYKLIYQQHINYIIRNINYRLRSIFSNLVQIPPSGKITINSDSGKFQMLTNQTSHISSLLFWNGYKKFEYSEIFEELSKKVDSFLDIGSNIGYYALLAAKANPTIKILAFEPALGPKFYLKNNIELNGFGDNITAIDIALSNQIGTIDFYEVENQKYTYLQYNLAGEGNTGTKKTSRNFVKKTVKTTTLDQFADTNIVTGIDLIKLDTEGTEIDIIRSGASSIKKYEPIVISETLFNTIEKDLELFFKELNYEMYNHTEKGLIKVNTITRVKDDGIRNCFFVPKSKLHLIAPYINT
ncbi:MAG: hypothetical protein COA49_00200 [Bacteroidetes bacterium]|nr:MAG: hypothetical protein COA49_00200 [Bacteroidota bacterium]